MSPSEQSAHRIGGRVGSVESGRGVDSPSGEVAHQVPAYTDSEAIHVDLSPLKEFGDTIHLRDIRLPEGVQVLDDPETTIASVEAPKGIAEGEEEAAATAE